MKKPKLETIICPICGREYLPAEIYLPNSFFGKPTEIERTKEGKIDTFNGLTMNLNETFTCENCGTTFGIKARVDFKTFVDESKDFSTEYVSPLHKKKLTLFED